MHHALVILGVFIALAGIGSIAAGAPSWALGLGLGSALIQSGAVGIVGGFLLVGIGFVLRALQEMSRRIDALTIAADMPANTPTARQAAPAPELPARMPAKREPLPVAPPPGAPGLSRREPPPFAKRQERLEQEQRQEQREEREDPAPIIEEDDRDFLEPDERPRARSGLPAAESRRAPERHLPNERSLPRERPHAGERLGERPLPPEPERRRERRFASERPAAADPHDPGPIVARNGMSGASTTVVRSGIIGGMAYTLYTDGSIEAELPIGTVRFASIEELQDHVSQTGEDADVDFGRPFLPKT